MSSSTQANQRAIAAAIAAGVPRHEAERIVDELATSTNGHELERWIVIPNWHGDDGDQEGFQHYRDRDPIWIKNYRRLLADSAYLRLTGHERALLHGLWLMYASSDGQIPLDARLISRQLSLRVNSSQLERLNHAGFLTFAASKPLALRYQRASPEKRREETPKSPTGTASTTTRHRTSNTTNASSSSSERVDPSKRCPDCQQPLGYGHLETCPRMPKTANQ